MFATFSAFVRSWRRPGGSSVFVGPPKRNPSFGETKRPRNPPKGSPEKGPKTGPEKNTKKQLFGTPFWLPWEPLGRLFALSWTTFLLSCRLLAQGAQKGRSKRRQREAKTPSRDPPEPPNRDQDRPREHRESPGRAKERPKRGQDSPREPKDRPKRTPESLKTAQKR